MTGTPDAPKLIHPHEKIRDAELVAVALLQRVHKAPYFKGWWRQLKLNPCPHYPSEVQARTRLERLTPTDVQHLPSLLLVPNPYRSQ